MDTDTIEDDIEQVETEIESRIREARRQLDLGREELLAELKTHSETLGKLLSKMLATRVDQATRDAADQLRDAQESLGELDRLLDREMLDDPETAEQLRRRVLPALDRATQSLMSLQRDFSLYDDLAGPYFDLTRRGFQQRLELARLHLVSDTQTLSGMLESLRRQLDAEPVPGPDETGGKPTVWEKLSDTTDEWMPYLKAFFQHPDEAAPRAPSENSVPNEKESET